MKTLILSILIAITQTCLPVISFAETTSSNTSLPTVSEAGTSTTTSSEQTSNDPYEGKKYPVSGFEGTEDGFTTAVNYITVIVIAFFGVSIPLLCWEGVKAIKTTPSLAIFLLGSAIYIIGELITTILYKNLAAKDASILISKEELGKQIESFEELLSKHESYLKTMKIKFYLAIAVTVVYAIAGIAAIVETVLKKQLACTSSGKDPTNAAATAPATTSVFNILSNLNIANAIAGNLTDSVPDVGSSVKSIGGGIIPDLDISISDLTQTYSLVKFVLLGLGGAAGAIFGLVFKSVVLTQKGFFSTLLTASYTRIALFLGAAAAVGVFIILVKKQMGKLEKRIDYLKNLIATLKHFQEQGQNGYAFSGGLYDNVSDYLPPVTLPSEIQNDAPSGTNLPCVTSTKDARVLGIDKNCDCANSANGCDPKAMPDARDSALKFPGSIMSSLDSATSSIKNLSGGNLSGSIDSLTNLARNAGKINRLKDKYLDKLQEHIAKEKLSPFDLSKEQNKIFDTVKNDVLKKLDSEKADKGMISKWGDSMFGTGETEKELPTLPKIGQNLAKQKEVTKDKNKAKDNALDAFVINDIDEALNFTPPPTAVDDETVILDDGQHDINLLDKNIFGILSDRYIKSAYPVFFKQME